MPDLADPKKFRLPIYNMRELDREISLAELRGLGVEEMPFHTYSRPIRSIFEDERGCLIALGAIPLGFGEEAVQPFVDGPQYRDRLVEEDRRQLRFEMCDAYPLFALLPVRLSPAWMELDTASTLTMCGRVLQAARV